MFGLELMGKAYVAVNLALSGCLSPSEVCVFRPAKVSGVTGKRRPNLPFECTSKTNGSRSL